MSSKMIKVFGLVIIASLSWAQLPLPEDGLFVSPQRLREICLGEENAANLEAALESCNAFISQETQAVSLFDEQGNFDLMALVSKESDRSNCILMALGWLNDEGAINTEAVEAALAGVRLIDEERASNIVDRCQRRAGRVRINNLFANVPDSIADALEDQDDQEMDQAEEFMEEEAAIEGPMAANRQADEAEVGRGKGKGKGQRGDESELDVGQGNGRRRGRGRGRRQRGPPEEDVAELQSQGKGQGQRRRPDGAGRGKGQGQERQDEVDVGRGKGQGQGQGRRPERPQQSQGQDQGRRRRPRPERRPEWAGQGKGQGQERQDEVDVGRGKGQGQGRRPQGQGQDQGRRRRPRPNDVEAEEEVDVSGSGKGQGGRRRRPRGKGQSEVEDRRARIFQGPGRRRVRLDDTICANPRARPTCIRDGQGNCLVNLIEAYCPLADEARENIRRLLANAGFLRCIRGSVDRTCRGGLAALLDDIANGQPPEESPMDEAPMDEAPMEEPATTNAPATTQAGATGVGGITSV